MKKIIFLFTCITLMAFSCSKSEDEIFITPPVEYSVQYPLDIIIIEDYLDTHSLNPDISDYASNATEANLIVAKTDLLPSLKSLITSTTYPKLSYKLVDKHNLEYKVYYLEFSEPTSNEKPTPLDGVYTAYRGTSLASSSVTGSTDTEVTATEFEYSPLNEVVFTLTSTISGWAEIFPLFSIGDFDEAATGNGPNQYTNYGAGMMFLPSGLAYYNGVRTNIPSYSPLVFGFKLFNLKRADNDNDGILTVDEIVRNTDGSFTYTDTDGDGYPDYIDFDDDNDGFPTKNETKYYLTIADDPLQKAYYYPYNGALVDDPLTLIDETKGIPNCAGNDFTTPTRVRKHLDDTCH